jgi:hypothetical protein
MEQKELDKIEDLLKSPQWLNLPLFELYIKQALERKADQKLAAQELDHLIGILQNHILSLSLFIKNNFMLVKSSQAIENSIYYTKQEIAIIYRVSVRTVSNWILDGLEATVIGGIKRISKEAVKEFQSKNKTKKLNWKSILRK